MTTTAEVRRMVQPLLRRHADLALVGRWIFVRPIEHFARAVLIDRTAYKEQFNPRWAVTHLFEIRHFLPLSWGDYLVNNRSSRPGIWRTFDPDVELSLIEAIEAQALPTLRAMTTLDDFLAFVSQHYFRHHLFEWSHRKIIVEVALGNLEAARAICKEDSQHWSPERPHLDEESRAQYLGLQKLCACLAGDDRRGIAALLHQWEAETVKRQKIEHLWESTPFPLETSGPTAPSSTATR
jgi:hypothetical protein